MKLYIVRELLRFEERGRHGGRLYNKASFPLNSFLSLSTYCCMVLQKLGFVWGSSKVKREGYIGISACMSGVSEHAIGVRWHSFF